MTTDTEPRFTRRDIQNAIDMTAAAFKKEFGHLVWSNAHMGIMNAACFIAGMWAGYLLWG